MRKLAADVPVTVDDQWTAAVRESETPDLKEKRKPSLPAWGRAGIP